MAKCTLVPSRGAATRRHNFLQKHAETGHYSFTIFGEEIYCRYLLIPILPFVATIIFELIFTFTAGIDIQSQVNKIQPFFVSHLDLEYGADDISNQISWQLSMVFHIFLSCISILMAISFITSRFKAKRVQAGYLILGSGFSFIIFVCLILIETEYIKLVIPEVARISDHILAMAKTVVSSWERGLQKPDESFIRLLINQTGSLDLVSKLIFVDIVTFSFLTLGAFAVSSENLSTGHDSPEDAFILSKKIARLKIILYWGSACLLQSVISLYMYFVWLSSFLVDAVNEPNDILVLGQVLIKLWAGYFTITLAMIFLYPLRLAKVDAVAVFNNLRRAQSNELKKKEWFEDHELRPTPAGIVSKAIALLGPLITGASLSFPSG